MIDVVQIFEDAATDADYQFGDAAAVSADVLSVSE